MDRERRVESRDKRGIMSDESRCGSQGDDAADARPEAAVLEQPPVPLRPTERRLSLPISGPGIADVRLLGIAPGQSGGVDANTVNSRKCSCGQSPNMPGESKRMPFSGLGLGKIPRTRMLPVVGSTWLSRKLMLPWWGKRLLALEAHEDRQHLAGLGGLILPSLIALRTSQQGGLVHVEVGVHRVQRDDRGQHRLVLVDQVAERQVVAADLAVDRRLDLGEFEVELVRLQVVFVGLDPRVGLLLTAALSWSSCCWLTLPGTLSLIARSRA